MCMAAASHFAVLVALCLALGLCDGCFISLIGPVARLIAGSSGTSQGIGFLLGACSLPLTAGPPIAGMLYDSIGNYSLAFLLAGVPPVLASLLMCCIHFVGNRSQSDEKRRMENPEVPPLHAVEVARLLLATLGRA
ncbi:hypothetical protein HPB47_013704 [Ixodes persulcatus]|uniref:Uncharacterized protein n=1 Tax=Ixodes persulcatus TaxID=34615 RepID=A0AC60QXV6_IXOPE|nr:hypothetical protein HPB47_013704 [Ixodes persulcatus]